MDRLDRAPSALQLLVERLLDGGVDRAGPAGEDAQGAHAAVEPLHRLRHERPDVRPREHDVLGLGLAVPRGLFGRAEELAGGRVVPGGADERLPQERVQLEVAERPQQLHGLAAARGLGHEGDGRGDAGPPADEHDGVARREPLGQHALGGVGDHLVDGEPRAQEALGGARAAAPVGAHDGHGHGGGGEVLEAGLVVHLPREAAPTARHDDAEAVRHVVVPGLRERVLRLVHRGRVRVLLLRRPQRRRGGRRQLRVREGVVQRLRGLHGVQLAARALRVHDRGRDDGEGVGVGGLEEVAEREPDRHPLPGGDGDRLRGLQQEHGDVGSFGGGGDESEVALLHEPRRPEGLEEDGQAHDHHDDADDEAPGAGEAVDGDEQDRGVHQPVRVAEDVIRDHA
mmetsp:Transcript_59742/g.98503  ORF Transcript_59742/g.98503 Transcript_59742/m.98503 type:complete len:398 (-) Transcript_59742:1342-2535(-)